MNSPKILVLFGISVRWLPLFRESPGQVSRTVLGQTKFVSSRASSFEKYTSCQTDQDNFNLIIWLFKVIFCFKIPVYFNLFLIIYRVKMGPVE